MDSFDDSFLEVEGCSSFLQVEFGDALLAGGRRLHKQLLVPLVMCVCVCHGVSFLERPRIGPAGESAARQRDMFKHV